MKIEITGESGKPFLSIVRKDLKQFHVRWNAKTMFELTASPGSPRIPWKPCGPDCPDGPKKLNFSERFLNK